MKTGVQRYPHDLWQGSSMALPSPKTTVVRTAVLFWNLTNTLNMKKHVETPLGVQQARFYTPEDLDAWY